MKFDLFGKSSLISLIGVANLIKFKGNTSLYAFHFFSLTAVKKDALLIIS